MRMTVQLRTRLAIAGALLIATTLAAGTWSVLSFRTVARVVDETVTDDERTTDATTKLSGALEREDDAMLLALSDVAKGKAEIVHTRARVEEALARVSRVLEGSHERDIATRLAGEIAAYHGAIDELVAASDTPDARLRYHEDVNHLLRRAVATTNQIRDDHFRSSLAAAEWARDRSARSMEIVASISVVAFLLLVAIVFHLARVVMGPLREMTRAVQAIRRGDFSQRVGVRRDDELGRLGAGLNQMADELEEFRRTNIGEVLRAKETLEATLAALPDAVFVIDPDRRVSGSNPRASAVFGAAQARSLDELPVPEPTRVAVDDVLRTSATPDAAVDLTKAIELDSRRFLPRIVPIEGRRGAVLVLSDVTALARLDEMRLELVAVASHELRTPLTTLRMTLLMMKERFGGYGERDRELVATALVGIDQLSALVDEFLELTQIEAGELRLHWGRVSLRELADQCRRTVAVACEDAGIELAVETDASLPSSIVGDRARLAMVVTNLLTNAVKYTPRAGHIELRVTADARSATISASDTGPGVPVEYRERVFERFFRVEHARGGEPRSGGVGIGLYIARQVVEAHGGTIRCEESETGGARFVITLPLER